MKHKEATVTRYLYRDMFNETLKYTKHMKESFFLHYFMFFMVVNKKSNMRKTSGKKANEQKNNYNF